MGQLTSIENELNHILQQDSVYFIEGSQLNYGLLAASVVIGLLICFFGLKLVKVLGALVGFLLGAGIGAAAGLMFGLSGPAFAGVVLGAGIVCGVISWFLYKLGVFLLIFAETMGIVLGIGGADSIPVLIAAIVGGLILAILAIRFIEPIVIVITGISGGLAAGNSAAQLMGLTAGMWSGLVLGIVAAVIGIGVQFMMHSRKIGKKERVYSKKVKEQDSMESEVEKARRLLDDDELDDDELDDDELDDDGMNDNDE